MYTIRWLWPSIHVRFSLSFSGGEGGEGPLHPRRKDVGMETHPERQCLVFPKGEVEGQAGFLVSLLTTLRQRNKDWEMPGSQALS